MSGDFVKVFILFVHTICPTFLPFFFFQGQGKKSHCVCVTFLLIFIGEHRRATEKKKKVHIPCTLQITKIFHFSRKEGQCTNGVDDDESTILDIVCRTLS